MTTPQSVLAGSPVSLFGGHVCFRVRHRTVLVCGLMVVALLALSLYAMANGTLHLTPGEVATTLTGGGTRTQRMVVLDIRAPRLVAALAVGAASGTSGAIFQSLSRNPLGSPDVVGFTTGAATGAVVQIIIFGGGPFAVAASAVIGGMGTALVVYLLAMEGGRTGGYRLILVGIGVGSILWSANAILITRGDADAAVSANIWLVGSLNARTWDQALPVLGTCLALIPVVAVFGRHMNLIEMGDDIATQIGVSAEPIRRIMMFVGVGLIAMATAAAGPISFVALAAPQMVRRLTRSDGAPLLAAAVAGATLLLGADLASQHLPINLRFPVGLMTGLLGGVYLIFLLTRSKQV